MRLSQRSSCDASLRHRSRGSRQRSAGALRGRSAGGGELEERLAAALTARSLEELEAQFADLPGGYRQAPTVREYLVGVFALGRTRAEVEARMAEALAAHLEILREHGDPLPEPHTDAGRVVA